MKIQSLKFIANTTVNNPLKTELDIGNQHEFQKIRDDVLPVAYIIQKEHLPSLREKKFSDLIIDRVRKNEHKGLSEYLLKDDDDRIPIIDGNFSDPNQMRRGIRTLLKNAVYKRKRNVFVVGVESAVFNKLWEEGHDDEKKRPDDKGAKGKIAYPDIDTADETICEILDELIKRCKVPVQLKMQYVGDSWKVDLVRMLIVLAAKRKEPVLIMGDSGTGKEVVARAIHAQERMNTPFLVKNCGGIPTTLFEVELFGYEPGCFTGGDPKGKKGLWELAGQGTLFLDEIGDLPLDQQVKILRVLQEGTITRLCGDKEIPVQAHVIAATNHDLSDMVQKGHFREDLYYRLRGFLIPTPALKDHPDDIPMLADYLWKKIANDTTKTLPNDILNELKLYRWPGNVRELKLVLAQLHAVFGTDGLSERNLNYAFCLQGQNWITRTIQPSERGMDLIMGDCWRHLRRVDDVIRALQHVLVRATDGKSKDKITMTSVTPYVDFHLGELGILCREHLLFHSEQTFSAVMKFKERLTYFHDLLHKDVSKAKEYWKETLAEEFESVLKVVFKEGERVLGKKG